MILQKGMQSQEIANIERAILSMGFEGVEPDGVFDEKTENVIKYIQKSHGLVVDGIIGPNTLAKMDEIFEPGVNNFSSSNFIPKKDSKNIITDSFTAKNLSNVHPLLKEKMLTVIGLASDENYTLRVTQGLRTFDEQNRLYRKRPKVTNARAGQSSHNYGVAADVCFIVNGAVSWDVSLYKNIGRWANQVGLTWGGYWNFTDYPHLQLNNIPNYRAMLETYNQAGGGDKGIKAVWSKYVG